MGVNLILDDKYDLGRAHNFAHEYDYDVLMRDIFALVCYTPKSLEELQEVQERIENYMEQMQQIGACRVIAMLKEQGAKVEPDG